MSGFIEFDFQELFDFGKNIQDPKYIATLLKTTLTELAKKFLKEVEINTRDFDYRHQSKTDNGNLVRHWKIDNPTINVVPTKTGYDVTLSNKAQDSSGRYYGSWVEEGHYLTDSAGNKIKWIYGRFFLKNTEISIQHGKIETSIFEKEFEKFLRKCIGGK